MAETIKDLNDLQIQVETEFEVNFAEIAANKEINWLSQLLMTASTDQREITQRFIFDHAQIKRTNEGQPPTFHNIQGQKAIIPLKFYDDGVAISALDLVSDKTGQTIRRISDLAQRAALHPKDLATDILENGDTSSDFIIFDGEQFFSNTHAKPNGVNIDNLLGALPFTKVNYQAARIAMSRFASDISPTDVYGIQPTHTIVPSNIELDLLEIVNGGLTPVLTANFENQLKGSTIPIIERRLVDVNDWFVATTELGVMPFIEIRHNEFGDFDLHAEIDDNSQAFRDAFERRWWVRAVMTVFPTRPETMIKVVNA